MRKLALALLLIFVLTLPAMAGEVRVWQSINNTGEALSTDIPVGLIAPRYGKIIGIAVIHHGTTEHTENFVSIRDVVPDGSGGTVAEVVAEVEHDADHGGTEWFLYPVICKTQIQVAQGAYTEVLIYHTR